ncbi:heptaprenyl diphosphate synthase component 1 [Neobacillus dielmonensis]|uniref:heptaprenyl diphosphate synthase component 1 n=1 Tax=Neobacillus dielmonensis TaxID=1347369 RepID=UPI0005A9A51D|nr:heptaprenyl diphosphate synthase component 1 [Neobacillus dielmonensis]
MLDIRQKYTNIKEKVEKYVWDTYLLKYIESPTIDQDKLLVLVSIADLHNLEERESENLCLSAMLIQIALDTHEHISKLQEDGVERQLTVLAGDYFSGLYYKLLADSKDISMIKTLSKGVKEVNESKITFYYQSPSSIDQVMESLKLIESSLMTRFAGYFKLDIWNYFLEDLLFFKRLLNEKEHFVQQQDSVLFESLKTHLYPYSDCRLSELSSEQQQQLLIICEQYLKQTKQAIEKAMTKVPYVNEFLKNKVTTLLNQHQPYVKTFAEEG